MSDSREVTIYHDPNTRTAGGRSTKYREHFCDIAIEMGRAGASKAMICSALEITPETMSQWVKSNLEFSEAIALSQVHAQAWWENCGMKGLFHPNFKGGVWGKSVSCRFPNDWREVKEDIQKHEHSFAGTPTEQLRQYVDAGRAIFGHLARR
jgi:hypothetical protein